LESDLEAYTDTTYETFEALLMKASPRFEHLWHTTLSEKLFKHLDNHNE
jgi:Protein of unknown function (DUF727)